MAERFDLFPDADGPVALVLQKIPGAAQELTRSVGTGAWELPAKTISGNRSFTLLDQPLLVRGEASASARIHDAAHTVDPFADGRKLPAPKGRVWTELELRADTSAAGEITEAGGTMKLSARMAADAELEYRHLLPASSGETRTGAVLSLAAGSRLPGTLDLQRLAPGEVHHYRAHLAVGFDLEAVVGWSASVKADVRELAAILGSAFDGVAGAAQATVDGTLRASLGLALVDDMTLTVGRTATLRPAADGWVRVRIARARERRFSAGVTLAVRLKVRAAGAANALLDRAFALVPQPRALATFREINALVADGGWDEVKERLSARARSEISAWLDDTGWRQELAESKTIRELLEVSGEVVEAYESLGEELQGFWDGLLGEVNLDEGSELRASLESLAELDAASFRKKLLGAEAGGGAAWGLLELFSGSSTEELVLCAEEELERSLGKVRDQAQRALGYLEKLDELPGGVLERFEAFAERTGIAKAVGWLAENATSLEQLEGVIDQRLEASVSRVVEKLADKTFDALTESERKQIESWAKRLDGLLAAPEKLEQKLRSVAAKLDGELGFSLALEVERLSRTSALLDLELDPENTATRQAVSRPLRSGAAGEILKDLPEPDEDEPPPYRLREAVFVSTRTRTSAVSLFFSLLGLRSSRSRWLRERRIEVRQEAGGELVRTGIWRGGFVRTQVAEEAPLFEAGAWVDVAANGNGPDPEAPFGQPTVDLRLTLQRDDRKTSQPELVETLKLIDQVGFTRITAEPTPPALPADGSLETRFALSLVLPGGLERFLDGIQGETKASRAAWSRDYLDAAERWWGDALVRRTSFAMSVNGAPVRLGWLLSTLVGDDDFRKVVLAGPAHLKALPKGRADLKLGSKKIPIQLVEGDEVLGDFKSLQEVADRHRRSFDAAREIVGLAAAVEKAKDAVAVGLLDDLAEATARTFGKATVTLWSHPALVFWLVLARISASGNGTAKDARGIATLRWRAAPDAPWEGPARWTLPNGLPDPRRKPGGPLA